jgi:membrane-associated protease RseP (regulator of RpoE activity)
LIAAAPLPPADGKKKRGPDYLLDADARLRLRFREPVSLIEPPSWWRAGPGLWLRTAPDGRRGFEVAVVIPGRAAAAAGIHAGDRIDSINGRSAEKMDFADATAALYGEPGSMVKLGVAGAGRVELIRGAKLDVGGSIPLTLPFETR